MKLVEAEPELTKIILKSDSEFLEKCSPNITLGKPPALTLEFGVRVGFKLHKVVFVVNIFRSVLTDDQGCILSRKSFPPF